MAIVYRTLQMKDTKFKVGDEFINRKEYHYQVEKSSDESEATLDESNWNSSSN